MDVGLLKRALDLFEAALDQPDEARSIWVEQACSGDPALLAQVARLMRADGGASAGLTQGLHGISVLGPPPERIGAYRLTDMLGEGGMGATFAAVRVDGLFDHDVAIKLIRPSHLPDTARAMFEKERRALAKLNHRNIAQLFDGGVTEDAMPYFIMERVRGVCIDAWAKGRGAREIVASLCDVCAGVQFAHQNFIVHADLKPANVLVNLHGDAKIVDFGVARILQEVEGENGAGVFPYTPGFASPARISGQAPTIGDDVFALGALARVLLEGRRCEARGDLNAIVARACAGDAAMRYPSAEALREDLKLWLEFRPLSARRGDGGYALRKLFRRRRLRVLVAGFGLIAFLAAFALTSFLYVRAEEARVAAETRFAEVRSLARYLLFDVYDRLEQTPHSLAVRRDVAGMAQAYLDQLARSAPASADVRRDLAEALVRVADIQSGREHANLGEFDAARANLASAEELAVNLPQDAAALELRGVIAVRQASIAMSVDQDLMLAGDLIARARALLAAAPADGAARRELAFASATLANWRGEYAQAREEALALMASYGDARDLSRVERLRMFRVQDALAEAQYYLGDLEAAEASYRRYAEMTQSFAAANPNDMEALRGAVMGRWALGTTLLARERPRQGLAELEAAAGLVPRLVAFEPDDEASQRVQRIVMAAHAQALALSGRFEEGASLLRAQVDARAAYLRADPHEAARARAYAVSLAMLADLYAGVEDAGRACPLYAEGAAILQRLAAAGQLSPQDRDSALRALEAGRVRHCAPAQ